MLQETFISSKKKLLRDKLSSDKNKTKTLYKITKILTSDTSENNFPESTSNKELADIFADFFCRQSHQNKIRIPKQ